MAIIWIYSNTVANLLCISSTATSHRVQPLGRCMHLAITLAKIKLNSKPNTKLLILFHVLASITTYALCQLCSINRAIYYPIKLGRALLAIPLEVQAVSTLLGLELPSQVYILEMELKHHFVSRVYKQRRE